MQHVGANADPGDYSSLCDRCQCPYLRSELTRCRDGLLSCDECICREPIELDEANAASAQETPQFGSNDGGRYPPTLSTDGIVTLEAKLATLGTP